MEVYNQLNSLICSFDAKCEKLEPGGITRDEVEAAVGLARLADGKKARVNIEKAVKIAKVVGNTELLVEFEYR